LGPAEYLVVEFPGNEFKSEIVLALAELRAQQDLLAEQQAALAQQPIEQATHSFDQQLIQIQKLSALKDQGLLNE